MTRTFQRWTTGLVAVAALVAGAVGGKVVLGQGRAAVPAAPRMHGVSSEADVPSTQFLQRPAFRVVYRWFSRDSLAVGSCQPRRMAIMRMAKHRTAPAIVPAPG